MAASYSYILLAILDLEIRLRLGHRRGIGIVDAFIVSYFSKLSSKKAKNDSRYSK